MTKIVSLVFGISSVLFSAQVAEATASSQYDDLSMQVHALSRFIDRENEKRIIAPLSVGALRRGIDQGTKWLIKAQEPTGHFRYEYLPYENMYRDDDNIVRQTGSLYALGEVLRKKSSDTDNVESATLRSLEYFNSLTKSTASGARCILNTSISTTCQLGATSLALIGLLDYLEHAPEKKSQYQKVVEGYATFIIEQQKENGGFRNKYILGKSNQSEAESPFSNGEALLALVRFLEYENRNEVKTAIDTAFTYLKNEPYDTALYLWIMAALKDLNRIAPQDKYVTYAHDFTKWRIEGGARYVTGERNTCAYGEGVASALTILEEKIAPAEYATYRNVLDRLNRLNQQFQITEADTVRVFFTSETHSFKELKNKERAIGGFLTSESEPTERIDFTQHCVSALLQTLTDLDRTSLTP